MQVRVRVEPATAAVTVTAGIIGGTEIDSSSNA